MWFMKTSFPVVESESDTGGDRDGVDTGTFRSPNKGSQITGKFRGQWEMAVSK